MMFCSVGSGMSLIVLEGAWLGWRERVPIMCQPDADRKWRKGDSLTSKSLAFSHMHHIEGRKVL